MANENENSVPSASEIEKDTGTDDQHEGKQDVASSKAKEDSYGLTKGEMTWLLMGASREDMQEMIAARKRKEAQE